MSTARHTNDAKAARTSIKAEADACGADFLDLGCSGGGSLGFAVTQFGLRQGLGVDVDPRKVRMALDAGLHAIVADATTLEVDEPIVRLTQGVHFLEHLPDTAAAAAVIRLAGVASSEAVFFRQPYFDADEHLAERGLKLFWSDWHGHPLHLSVADLVGHLDALVLEGVLASHVVLGRGRVEGSADPAVHPLESPRDQHTYDESLHGRKPWAAFDIPVYREVVAIGLKPAAGDLDARLGRYASFCEYLDGTTGPRFFHRWSARGSSGRA